MWFSICRRYARDRSIENGAQTDLVSRSMVRFLRCLAGHERDDRQAQGGDGQDDDEGDFMA